MGERERREMAVGGTAYATGNDVAFAPAPDLHTAAHEAAHIVQQRGGVSLKSGIGEAGDAHEQRADAVADLVVRGESAAALLSLRDGGAGSSSTHVVQRKTTGEEAYGKAHPHWLDPNESVKGDVHVIKIALREIKGSKSVAYNQRAGMRRIASALAALGKSKDISGAEAEWDWLVANRTAAAQASYKAKEEALFDRLETPLAALGAQHPKGHTQH